MTNQTSADKLFDDHHLICEKLNIDAPTEGQSWNSFKIIRETYNLDGEPLHWLCCSLYVTCWQTVTRTVTNTELRGNCVSLTKLLRLCNINLREFFKKIKQWMEMVSLPEEHRNAINNVQHNFSVSMSIYGKFCEVFTKLFLPPNSEEQKQSKKSKPQPCSPNKLQEFCWTLFVCAKAEYPEQKGDVVTSWNMMLCCLDMVYANAIADNRRDIVNSDFSALPPRFLLDGAKSVEPVCIIEAICEHGCGSHVINTKNTSWKDIIEKFIQTNVLRGDANSFMDLISVANFDDNLKSLNNMYDTFILTRCEFDERIALGQKILENTFTSQMRTAQTEPFGTPERIPLRHQTPLSGRNRISSNDLSKFTPISTANASANKLRMKLTGYDDEPFPTLQDLFKYCNPDPTPMVKARLADTRVKFLKRMLDQKWTERSITDKFRTVEALYYRLLEYIIRSEMRKRPLDKQSNALDIIRQLCYKDMFNKTLIVCSAEIVIYAHNLQQNFPWILNIFDMEPFIFYRIIEIVILNHNDLLSRDIIKHLTTIEEQCMESLCWHSSSSLWTILANLNNEVPTSQQVESSTDLAGITPHKPWDSASKANSQLKLESSVPRSNVNQLFLPLNFDSPLKLPIPNGSVSKQQPGARSLILFFRKFYALAAGRMNHLCQHLNLAGEPLQNQIWTIFEDSIVRCNKQFMRDRHLDQMLMCAIYVFVKIKKRSNTFADIMKYYRSQPQSNSYVYRSVLIERRTPEEVEQLQKQHTNRENDKPSAESRRCTPADLAGISVQHGVEERGDIIRFYNTVYVKEMQQWVTRFGNGADEVSLMLSPLPKAVHRSMLLSPKQVDGRIPLYVTPMDKKGDLKESPNSITFVLDRSPSKALQNINHIVKTTDVSSCKRSLNDPDSYNDDDRKKPKYKKWDRLISDRQQQESSVNSK